MRLLALLLLVTPAFAAGPPVPSRFPVEGSEEAWRLIAVKRPPLPAWARTLAKPMPRTTAAMLALDHLHRAENPLGAALAARLRWAAADAMNCDYGRRYAEFDLRRAGASLGEIVRLRKGGNEEERALRDFARKLTLAAYSITDEEMAALIAKYGPAKVVAMVHSVAYSNFQCRILLALRVQVEDDGPYPPLDVRPDPNAKPVAPPGRPGRASPPRRPGRTRSSGPSGGR